MSFLALRFALFAAISNAHTYLPPDGYVPNAETAKKIAEAVLQPIYGDSVLKERPFQVKLENGVWKVSGSVHGLTFGGVAEIEIEKMSGKILTVTHGK